MISTGPPPCLGMDLCLGLGSDSLLGGIDSEALFEGFSEADWCSYEDSSSSSGASSSSEMLLLEDFASAIKSEAESSPSPSSSSSSGSDSVLSDNDICELLDVHLDSLSDLSSATKEEVKKVKKQKELQSIYGREEEEMDFSSNDDSPLNGGRDLVLSSVQAQNHPATAQGQEHSLKEEATSFNNNNTSSKSKGTENVSQCSICKLVFSSPEQLSDHQVSGLTSLRCCMCDKDFSSASKLSSHHRKHSKEKPFQCRSCGKNYTQRTTLARHQLHYCATLRAKCEDAEKKKQQQMVSVVLLVNERIPAVAPANDSTATAATKCKICDKEFFDAASLSDHTNLHLGHKTCCLCSKVLGNKSKLLTHHRSHTKESPYACTLCDKRFSENSTLRKHLATHGAKAHKCDKCGKGFARKDYLAKHALTHQQTYKCSECSYVCHSRGDIERHVGIHSVTLLAETGEQHSIVEEKLFAL